VTANKNCNKAVELQDYLVVEAQIFLQLPDLADAHAYAGYMA
jgi:hypothetical protein